MMFTNEQIDYLNSLLDDDETSPLVDSILDKLDIAHLALATFRWLRLWKIVLGFPIAIKNHYHLVMVKDSYL